MISEKELLIELQMKCRIVVCDNNSDFYNDILSNLPGSILILHCRFEEQ